MRARPVFASRCVLGESPWWDASSQQLVWVDIETGRVHRGDPTTGDFAVAEHEQPVTAVLPRRSGGHILARRADIVAWRPSDRGYEPLASISDLPQDLRFNDGGCDPAGRLWIGTLSESRQPRAALYRLEPGGTLQRALEGLTVSNGLDWSLDGSTLYHVDTPTAAIDTIDYDVELGTLGERRTFVRIPGCRPDGLTVDADGGVWVALFGSGAVHRYDPTGVLDAVVEIPTAAVTSCAFGGSDLHDLFVTTARLGTDGPDAGAVFHCRPGVSGRPAVTYAG
jgi:sugar lactone lactonase YvrE